MTSTIVSCPLHGSPAAERALPTALDVAALFGASLELFSAVEDPHMVGRRETYLEQIGAAAQVWARRLGVELWVVTSLSQLGSRPPGHQTEGEANYVRRLAECFGAHYFGQSQLQRVARMRGSRKFINASTTVLSTT